MALSFMHRLPHTYTRHGVTTPRHCAMRIAALPQTVWPGSGGCVTASNLTGPLGADTDAIAAAQQARL